MRNDFATGESTQKVLRPHQTHGLDLLRNSIRQGHKRIMFKAPVSYGKTLIAATIVRNMQARHKRVWFVCDSITLIDQTVSSFYAEGVYGIGVIQADHQMTDFHKPIQICSVQTLRRRRKLPEKPEVMLVDEAHCKDEWLLTLLATEEWADVIVIGLSATPWSKSLGLHYSDLVMPISMEELTQKINPETGNPYMAPFRIYTPGYVEKLAPKIAKMKTVQTRYGSDYDESGQLELLDTPELVADIVQTWKEKSERRPTLGFFVNRAHAAKIQQRFVDAGIGWGYIDGYTDRAERNRIKERLDAGEIAGVASVDAMIKGIDWKIGCLIWGRITKSKILLVQGDGRGGRMNSWADCITLDHAGNHARLGLPTDIDKLITSLDTSKKGDKSGTELAKEAPKPKECPKCGALKPTGARECPSCHFVPAKVSDIEEVDGKLIEMRELRARQDTFLGQLKHYATAKGKSENYVIARYKQKFGSWPTRHVDPIPPTADFVKAMQGMNIRWAKDKGRKAA